MPDTTDAFDARAVRVALEELRRADPGLRLFGAMGHRYRFRPPASDQLLAEFERRHRVRLPSDYQSYLAEIGNGGPGPFYGVFPLGLFDGAGDGEVAWSEDDGTVGTLSKPFPHRQSWSLPQERFSRPEFESEEEEDAWHAVLDAE